MENVGKSNIPSGCPFLWDEIHQVLAHRWLLNWRQGFTNSQISRNLLLKCFKKHRQTCETEKRVCCLGFFKILNLQPASHNQELWKPLATYLQLYHSLNSILGKEYVNISFWRKNKANFYKHKRMQMKPYLKVEQLHIKTLNSWKCNKSRANSQWSCQSFIISLQLKTRTLTHLHSAWRKIRAR